MLCDLGSAYPSSVGAPRSGWQWVYSAIIQDVFLPVAEHQGGKREEA